MYVYIFPSDADTDVEDRNSMTPLMLAARNGHEEVKCFNYLVTPSNPRLAQATCTHCEPHACMLALRVQGSY